MKVFVFAEKTETLEDLCLGAHRFSDNIEAVSVGVPEEPLTADKVWVIQSHCEALYEDCTETLARLCEKEMPGIMLIAATKRTRLIAGRLAAILGTSVIPDIVELMDDGTATRMVYGGAAVSLQKATGGIRIVLLGQGTIKPMEVPAKSPEIIDVDYIEPKHGMKVIKREQKPKVTVNLTGAKRVVAIGRGVAKKEDIDMIKQLADVIGAEIGCTRPIAEGEKWMPRETYIGVSGLTVTPDLYIGIGVSGQVQHMVGVNRSKTVVAINKNKDAAIFSQTDYGIVGDLYKIVPALIEGLK